MARFAYLRIAFWGAAGATTEPTYCRIQHTEAEKGRCDHPCRALLRPRAALEESERRGRVVVAHGESERRLAVFGIERVHVRFGRDEGLDHVDVAHCS